MLKHQVYDLVAKLSYNTIVNYTLNAKGIILDMLIWRQKA